MKNNRKNRSFKARYIATASMLTALCCVVLSMGTVIETMDLSFAAISCLILWISLLEFGKKTAWIVFFATSVISILLIPSKFPAIFFICITGWYPMVKFELSKRIKKKILLWICKFAVFNLSAACSVAVVYFLGSWLGIQPGEEMTKIYLAALLVIANFAFMITDILMDKLVVVYIYKLRDKLKKLKLVE